MVFQTYQNKVISQKCHGNIQVHIKSRLCVMSGQKRRLNIVFTSNQREKCKNFNCLQKTIMETQRMWPLWWTTDQWSPCLHPVTAGRGSSRPPPTPPEFGMKQILKMNGRIIFSCCFLCQTVASKALASSHRAPPKQVQDTMGCDFISTTHWAVVT